jgi:hypothetical protein
MKNPVISLILLLLLLSCNGPKSGPLQRESFDNTDFNQNMKEENYKAKVSREKINVNIESCEGCITIADLLDNKKSYSGKIVKIKGQVTKFNQSIMGRNWVHIQDGSAYRGDFDLTITTDVVAPIGDTLTFEGTIVLDQDFGYGYKYDVLMENGKPVL